jgi:hypothetical protein
MVTSEHPGEIVQICSNGSSKNLDFLRQYPTTDTGRISLLLEHNTTQHNTTQQTSKKTKIDQPLLPATIALLLERTKNDTL